MVQKTIHELKPVPMEKGAVDEIRERINQEHAWPFWRGCVIELLEHLQWLGTPGVAPPVHTEPSKKTKRTAVAPWDHMVVKDYAFDHVGNQVTGCAGGKTYPKKPASEQTKEDGAKLGIYLGDENEGEEIDVIKTVMGVDGWKQFCMGGALCALVDAIDEDCKQEHLRTVAWYMAKLLGQDPEPVQDVDALTDKAFRNGIKTALKTAEAAGMRPSEANKKPAGWIEGAKFGAAVVIDAVRDLLPIEGSAGIINEERLKEAQRIAQGGGLA